MSRPRQGGAPRARCGFVLPFVVLALAAGSLLVLAFAGEAFQANRAAHASVIGDDAGYHTDEALTLALSSWTDDSLWTHPLGSRRQRVITVMGEAVTVEWYRAHPLAGSVRATGRHTGTRRLETTVRDHVRAVWFTPPPLPVHATLTTWGTVSGTEGTLISGSDMALPGSPCGSARDTASVPTVMAAAVAAPPSGSWPGAPAAEPPANGLEGAVRSAIGVIDSRVPATDWGDQPRLLPEPTGWRALRLESPTVAIAGPSRWHGLLFVRGRLVLSGAVHLTGVLVVDGSLDATAAQLAVQGAVVVADTSASGVMLGGQGRLFYDRCATQMALATVARPSLAPFSLWQSLPH